MPHPKTSVSALTLVAFIQGHVIGAWAAPTEKLDQPSSSNRPLTTLHLGKDPYTQASFRLQYDSDRQDLLWQLMHENYALSSHQQPLPGNTLTLDKGLVSEGDLIIVAGRTLDQCWFIRAWNSQGDSLWQQQGEDAGRLYDLAISDDGLTLYASGSSDQGELLLVLDALSGVVKDQPVTTIDAKSVYRQIVAIGNHEVIAAHHTSKQGALQYVKWQEAVDVVTGESSWHIEPDFCRGCQRQGVTSVALKANQEHQHFYSVVASGTIIYVELKDAVTGETLSSETLPASGDWEQAVRVDDAIAVEKVALTGKQLAIMNNGCQLGIRRPGASETTVDLCRHEKVALRKLLQMPSSSDNQTTQPQAEGGSISAREGLSIVAEVLGIVGAFGLITLVTGLGFYVHGKYKGWKDKLIAAGEREDQRRQEEGIFIRKIKAHRPTFLLDTLILPDAIHTQQDQANTLVADELDTALAPATSHSKSILTKSLLQTPLEVLQALNSVFLEVDERSNPRFTDQAQAWIAQHRRYFNLMDEVTGNTPLHFLADVFTEDTKQKDRIISIARTLLRNGADLSIRSHAGYTSLELAAANNLSGLFRVMLPVKT